MTDDTASQRLQHHPMNPTNTLKEQLRTVPEPAILTETQRETLERAVERGYFDIPRGVTLEELADEYGVRHQAISERLRRGISALVSQSLNDSAGVGADERIYWATTNAGDNADAHHSTPYCPELRKSVKLPKAVRASEIDWYGLHACPHCIGDGDSTDE